MKIKLLGIFLFLPLLSMAQIGEHRNDFFLGFNGGYVMSNVGFTPKVTQGQHGGITGGITFRYVCEKYFKTICSLQAEINYASLGWKENILDGQNNPVVNTVTGVGENYSRTINYVQVPLLAHLAWGKEYNGMQFFFNAGPQFGFYLNESTSMNFDFASRNTADRSNSTVAQDTMSIQHKFDYGIAAGLGFEYDIPRIGRFAIEGCYYYGLGNIYRDTKKDYFSKSNFGNIIIKMSYLFDITKLKHKLITNK